MSSPIRNGPVDIFAPPPPRPYEGSESEFRDRLLAVLERIADRLEYTEQQSVEFGPLQRDPYAVR